ncbi:MAG TPA: hypothetical protein DCM05_16055 [Elusimicrobia bacterium]|nr:hypothetical protein [Elusimicrobiota bacterium]
MKALLLFLSGLLWAAPSTPNPLNCAEGEESSNYAAATWPKEKAEVHVVSVGKGRYGDMAVAKARGALGAVRVVLHKTRKPAVLVLSAQESTLWELKLMREASLKELILQGGGTQTVKGLPAGVPVQHRTGVLGFRWEGGGTSFEKRMQELRCLTGLREASFQGCRTGLVFEVPHYRQDEKEFDAPDGLPSACPAAPPGKDALPVKPPKKIKIQR